MSPSTVSLRELRLQLLVVLRQGVELLGQGGGGLEPGEHDDEQDDAQVPRTQEHVSEKSFHVHLKARNAQGTHGVLAAREPNPNIMN